MLLDKVLAIRGIGMHSFSAVSSYITVPYDPVTYVFDESDPNSDDLLDEYNNRIDAANRIHSRNGVATGDKHVDKEPKLVSTMSSSSHSN
jgi:hypothetical protein